MRAKAGQRPGRPVGFPRFKRRRHEQGFRADNGPDTVRTDGRTVVLPKLGRVVMVEELRFPGSIREVTINRTAGTWFACFCIQDGQAPPAVTDRPTVGVDVGIGTTAVCSDGTVFVNPRSLASGIKRLRRLDKAIARSRNVHGKNIPSGRRERLYEERRRVHARVVNVRSDRHHKATTAIAKPAGRVVVETLNVAGMVYATGGWPGPYRMQAWPGFWPSWSTSAAGTERSSSGRTGGSHHRSCVPTVAG